jgi:CubicO group peptidase (beta-lactamase class C family)
MRTLRCLLAISAFAAGAHAADYWDHSRPEDERMNSAALSALSEDLARRGTKSLVVARHGKIVFEWYAEGRDASTRHYTASLAKAVVGGVSLAVAASDGKLSANDAAARFIPSWRDDPRKSKIAIRHLATHSSGLEDAEEDGKPHADLTGWKGAFWRRDPDPFSIALDDAPVLFEPGSAWHYSNTGIAALAYAVTASLRGALQRDIRSLLRDRVMRPLAIPGEEWSIGYGRPYTKDGMDLWAAWGGGSFTPRAIARVGELMLRAGVWDNQHLIHPRHAREAVRHAGTPPPDREKDRYAPASGLGWYTNVDNVWPAAPRDTFAGAGAGHQVLIASPSLHLVAVRSGDALEGEGRGQGFWTPVYLRFIEPLMKAVETPAVVSKEAPYPPSPVIRGLTFAPVATILRQAIDSDNWPITWGDDDHLYTSYGDGWGFDPRVPEKLSLGFARVEGTPENFRGVNIRSETGEWIGDGLAGPKSSGMLMVDGVLYMLVRNMGNTRLAWSPDRGRTWHWGLRFDVSFGAPSFVNFGRNYQGARDEFVYLHSLDGPSAYQPEDALVLARVPRSRIRDRDAYEFFVRLDETGRPVWSADIRAHGPVFRYPGRCERVDVVYNPGLKRYLLALSYDHAGGWGIFDAPEPWGPWTTAFHTNDWGLGGTHGYRLPAKWIGANGHEMTLVFSGVSTGRPNYDAFSVRRFRVETR